MKTINSAHPGSSDWIRVQSQVQVEEKGNKVNGVHQSKLKSSGIATALSTHRAHTVNKQVPISKCCWTPRYLCMISLLMHCGHKSLASSPGLSRLQTSLGRWFQVPLSYGAALWIPAVLHAHLGCSPGLEHSGHPSECPVGASLSHRHFCACVRVLDSFINPWLFLSTLFLTFHFPNHLLY